MNEIISRLRLQNVRSSSLIGYLNFVVFLLAVAGIAYLLYARSNADIIQRPQLAAETIALGALIVTSFGTLSTFIFNWKNASNNSKVKDDEIKRLEIENAVLKTKLEYEQDRKKAEERTNEILKLVSDLARSVPKELPPPKSSRRSLPPKSK